MNERERQLIASVQQRIEKMRNQVQRDPYRLHYHLMPPVGLLNDPNGFVQFHGEFHIFYQWNPFETTHGAKFWGHYVSADFVAWKEQPIALAPAEDYERNGCYSGSAVEHLGKLYLFYTGNVKKGTKRETYQCLAVSEDGIHFEKKGPVIDLPEGFTAHFRDPKVWKRGNTWYMVIGAQDKQEQGCVVMYSSADLYNWKYEKILVGSMRNGLGEFGYMWECPDLFSINGEEVLIFSPQGIEPKGTYYQNVFQSGYVLGNLDYEQLQFEHGAFAELDRGFDFYAPQTTEDNQGRRILVAWMGITDEQEQLQPTIKNGWVHALTIPREIQLRGNKIYQQPVQELKKLRGHEVAYAGITINHETKTFAGISGAALELVIDNMETHEVEEFSITCRNHVEIVYRKEQHHLTLRRRTFDNQKWEERVCAIDNLRKLQIFLDVSSIEIFVNDGEEVFTARFFPDPENKEIVFANKGSVSFDLQKWSLQASGGNEQTTRLK
ncbi:glycoside hydrolase family 32 protein [Virgibacillus soli]|uniref:glycoside hydrolase family 32 protein n=1 Tax=Paracerasibacillus soli TaxID=480284 RepID=UPI0035E5EF58